MDNQQKAQATDTNAFQEKLPEYRFVYENAKIVRVAFCAFATIISIMIWAMLSFDAIALIFVLPMLLFFSPLYLISTRGITINQKGITCTGVWWPEMPRYCAWDEFQHIFRTRGISVPFPEYRLIFINRYDKKYLLQEDSYVGVEHALSLKKAIEQFIGPIRVLDGEEIEKIPVLSRYAKRHVNQQKNATFYVRSHIAIFVCLCSIVAFTSRPIHLLTSGLEILPYILFFAGPGFMALWYAEKNKHKRITFILYVILVSVAVSFPWTMKNLPYFFGKQEQVVFSVSKEDDKEQQWTAITDSRLTFSIRVPPKDRVFKGVGTEHSMTVYRGPGSSCALPDSERRALFR